MSSAWEKLANALIEALAGVVTRALERYGSPERATTPAAACVQDVENFGIAVMVEQYAAVWGGDMGPA